MRSEEPLKLKTREETKSHARLRAMERLGIHLTDSDYEELSNKIRLRKGRFLHRLSSTKTIWEVDFEKSESNNGKIFCIYCKRVHGVATVMNNKWLKKYINNS